MQKATIIDMTRKRNFDLPLFNKLNKDQLKSIHLPKNGTHLIIGGPGTGKSVVALLRVREHHNEKNPDYCFLVFNKLLHEASQQLMGRSLESATWITWFKMLFRSMADRPVNVINGENWNIDWNDVQNWLNNQESVPEQKVKYLIIDEGQDMPPAFYNVLVNIGFENIYVVADQNQPLTRQNSNRRDLEEALLIERDDVVELKYNYRNTYPIARLAREFYTGDPASPPPDLPIQGMSAKTPLLVQYKEDGHFDLCKAVQRILIMSDNNPSKLIGVLTPNNEVRKKYIQKLNECCNGLNLRYTSRIVTYDNSNSSQIEECSFDYGGIFVINSKACKGLEFDTVFIADINDYYYYPDIEDDQKKLFYVMVARARENIFILKKSGHCRIEAMLPQDQTILSRWEG